MGYSLDDYRRAFFGTTDEEYAQLKDAYDEGVTLVDLINGGGGFTPPEGGQVGEVLLVTDDDPLTVGYGDAGNSVVLVWDPVEENVIPAGLRNSSSPKEFRCPVDPSTLDGVVLNAYDNWRETAP